MTFKQHYPPGPKTKTDKPTFTPKKMKPTSIFFLALFPSFFQLQWRLNSRFLEPNSNFLGYFVDDIFLDSGVFENKLKCCQNRKKMEGSLYKLEFEETIPSRLLKQNKHLINKFHTC